MFGIIYSLLHVRTFPPLYSVHRRLYDMESPVITLNRGGSKARLVVMRRWVGGAVGGCAGGWVGQWEGMWVGRRLCVRVSVLVGW